MGLGQLPGIELFIMSVILVLSWDKASSNLGETAWTHLPREEQAADPRSLTAREPTPTATQGSVCNQRLRRTVDEMVMQTGQDREPERSDCDIVAWTHSCVRRSQVRLCKGL